MDRSTICAVLFGTLMYLSVGLHTSHSELIVFPRDTEVVVNHSTYFNCSTSIRNEQIHWYHYRVGENRTNYVYYKGQFNKDYADRYSIAVDTVTGEYNLIIRSVQPGDAGRYVCEDDEGLGSESSAELIVLDSRPVCESSMKPEGLVGPNSCGLPIDELQLSCSVSYIGNIHPILQWKTEGDDTPILKGITGDYSVTRATMNMTMSSGVEMDGASFTCTTTRAHDKQHSCTSGQVKVNYQPTILNLTKGETITCSANASVPCTYRWFYGNDTLCPASCDEVITITRLEDYSCEANCIINGISCTFVAMRIYVFEDETTHDQICKPYRDAIICIFVIILSTLIVGSLFVFWYLRVYRPKKLNQKEKNVGVSEEENTNPIVSSQANKEKAAKEKMANINASSQEETKQLMSKTNDRATKLKVFEKRNEEALRIKDLENELIYKRNEVIAFVDQIQKLSDKIKTLQEKNEVSDNTNSQLIARVKDLEQGLYPAENIDYADKPTLVRTIITGAAKEQHKPINGMTILGQELFVSHENYSVIEAYDSETLQFVHNWEIKGMLHPLDIASCKIANCIYIIFREDNESESQIMKLEPKGKLIKKWSTGGDSGRLSTYESNVIVCLFEKQLINEYSEEGSLIHTVRLSPGDGFNHPRHAIKVTSSHFVVCHGDAKDELHRVCIVNVQGNIIKELGQGEKLNVPICLVEDSERSILIADRDNQRIRLMNCLLNHQRTLIRKETKLGPDGYPIRIWLDETNGRLFVAVNTLRSKRKEWKDGRILVFKIISR